jgi:Ca-activated chloride channel family protein
LILISDGEIIQKEHKQQPRANKLGMRIVTVGIEQKRRNNTVEGKTELYKATKGSNDEVVITKLNKPGLEPIAKATKAGT